jgi:hypothetical protein
MTNGLSNPFVMWPNSDKKLLLIDGLNRLDALAMLGLLAVDASGCLGVKERGPIDRCRFECAHQADPYALALSLNVHRRHLTNEQKRELIAKVIEANPNRSDRQIAELVKRDRKTVGSVRAQMEDVGRIPHVGARTDTRGRKQPAKKVKAAVDDPAESAERMKAAHAAANLSDAAEEMLRSICIAEAVAESAQKLVGRFDDLSDELKALLLVTIPKAAEAWTTVAAELRRRTAEAAP